MAVSEAIRPFAGTEVDPEAAETFLKWWFTATDKTTIVTLSDTESPKNYTYDRETLIKAIKERMEDMCAEGRNLYYVTATTTGSQSDHKKGRTRPKAKEFKALKGVWIDLDVKENAFPSMEAAEDFVKNLPEQPGAIVRTGSGGLHLYWRVKKLSDIPADEVGLRWWSYIQSLAPEGVEIDRLTDVKTRLLRLPGSVRWPSRKKDGDSLKAHQVTVEYTGAPDLTADTVSFLTEETYEKAHAHVVERQATEEALLDDLAANLTDLGPWGRRIALTLMDELVEQGLSWTDVLEPVGWTITKGTDGSGEVVWSRPGGSPRSATTGEPEEDSGMSLLSGSPDTGLLDLYEAEVRLTKWRVLLRLHFNDDLDAALEWVTENV